jgi:hypothetical protein
MKKKRVPGFTADTDRLTVLLGINANGNNVKADASV